MRFVIETIDRDGNVKEEGYLDWTPGREEWSFKTSNERIAEALREIDKRGTVNKRVSFESQDMIADGVKPVEVSDESFLGALRDHMSPYGVLRFKKVEDGT